MSADLVPAAVRARLAPGMAEAMGHELAAAQGKPPPRDLAEQRARGLAAAAFWSRELQPVAAIEDHKAPGPAGEVPVRLFRPHADKDGPTPVLLYIHGGGWAQGSVLQNEPAIHALASGSGWCVAALSYRLAPENPYPAGLEDCLAVAAWLRTAGPGLGLDPARIALGGASAGANLALAAGLALRDRGEDASALLLFYGIYGHDLDTPSYREFGDGSFGLSLASMAQYFDWYDPTGRRNSDPLISPLLGDLRGLPRSFLAAAELDVLRDDTLRMHERLLEAGVPAELRQEQGLVHGFINRASVVPAARGTLAAACAFLERG